MEALLQQFQHLKIPLEEITSATNEFNDEMNCIGRGGFGKVYKGKVSHSNGRTIVAIKRLDRRHGQGTPEFLKEITMLSGYKHENLISLLGFCCEGNEMILVYEHASRGSLDRHLNSPHLTWSQRLKICVDAAKGISYLHDPRETHQRLIHCDMKSGNILLDDQWNAKVSDFGLSIMGPANEQRSTIVTVAVGTPGYCDPQYAITHTLTKESDVYSFGVVLFEVLCGTLCCTYSNNCVQQILVPSWIESYKQKKLSDIIIRSPSIQPLEQIALDIFSDIAYQCLKESREDRPNMVEVVTQLEIAFEIQAFSEQKLFDYEEMTKSAEPPLNYETNGELWKLLSEGVLLNYGKTWFLLNKKGEHCEMISFAECLDSAPNKFKRVYESRFVAGTHRYSYGDGSVKACVKTQFLSPGITYTVNLVFKFFSKRKLVRKLHAPILLKYKLQGETKTSISHLAYEREDGWWMCELYQFTSDHRSVDLEILLIRFNDFEIAMDIEGIEFWPLQKDDVKQDMQRISDSNSDLDLDSDWKKKLPKDYRNIMKWSNNNSQQTTEKEAYSILRKGFLIRIGKKESIWFFLDKNGKKCHMLLPRGACQWISKPHKFMSLPESRFGVAYKVNKEGFTLQNIIRSQLLSSQTTYASYLVYKLPETISKNKAPMIVALDDDENDYDDEDYYEDEDHYGGEDHYGDGDDNGEENDSGDEDDYWDEEDYREKYRDEKVKFWYIFLVSPQTPVIRPMTGLNTHNPINRLKMKGFPQQRKDGWMEVQIWEFKTSTTTEIVNMNLLLNTIDRKKLKGLIIQGIEFRPI